MSDQSDDQSLEIVDLDTCSKKKSILIAVAVTALLGLVPYSYMLFLCHYVIGGLAAAGHFARRHQITITFWQGAKLGSISAFLGMLLVYVAFPLWILPNVSDEEWAKMSEQVINDAYEKGRPEVAEFAEGFLVSDNVPMFLTIMIVIGTIASLLLGALGGGLGASLFKRGPLAQ